MKGSAWFRSEGLGEAVAQDVRFGLRSLCKNPGFTIAAIVTLALGIGSTTAVFGVVNGVLLRPLPFHEPDRLVMLEEKWLPRFSRFEATPAHFLAWKEQNQTLSNIAAFDDIAFNLTGDERPERLSGARVSGDLLSVLGVQPMLGRGFAQEEDKAGNNQVVILSHNLWQRRFGSDPAIVGRTLTLNGIGCSVIGIMPPGFAFPREAEIWKPMGFTDQELSGGGHFVWAVGRLRPGVTTAQAKGDLESILRGLPQHPWSANALPLLDYYVGSVHTALRILLAAVAFVLLIACANVANLLLARASGRQKEIALRLSIGATRGRIIQQLLTESLLLASIGGALGLTLAAVSVEVLRRWPSANIPRLDQVSLDYAVLLFVFAVSTLTGLLFGVAPALRLSRTDLHESLKTGGRITGTRINRSYRGLLVVSELAFALVLLVGAGLLLKSFTRLVHVDPGFQAGHLFATDIFLPAARYSQPVQRIQFVDRLVEQLKIVPGIREVAASSSVPLAGKQDVGIRIDGRPAGTAESGGTAQYFAVTAAYARTMGIAVTRGRFISEDDLLTGRRVVVINETMAKQFFSNQNPIGQRLDISGPTYLREIIGVTSDVKRDGLDTQAPAQVYEPFWQTPSYFLTVLVRTTGDTLPLAAEIRRQVSIADRDLPISNFRAMDEVVDRSLGPRRFSAVLLTVFTGLAVILAFVGLYGLMAYIVTQRTQEFGIRLALGAQRNAILWLVIVQSLRIILPGVIAGLLAAFVLSRFLQSLLYGVATTDPGVFALLPAALAVVALAAAVIPAVRALRLNPVTSLRAE
jgi:putative ABC transport system permease protein